MSIAQAGLLFRKYRSPRHKAAAKYVELSEILMNAIQAARRSVQAFAPAKTPEPVVRTLNAVVVQVLALPEIKEQFLRLGAEAKTSTPEELSRLVRDEVQKWARVAKDAGLERQ